MNFLAHAYLAGSDPDIRFGGVIGDFIKGRLPAGLPPAVAAGVALHRRIDSFAETHPAFCRSRNRVGALRRRYAGIMVDLFYDHMLARYWAEFSDQALLDFVADIYALMSKRAPLMPPRLTEIFPHMRDQDWLSSYRSIESTGFALDRIAAVRLRRANPLAGAIEELREHYRDFELDFREFVADASAFAQHHCEAYRVLAATTRD